MKMSSTQFADSGVPNHKFVLFLWQRGKLYRSVVLESTFRKWWACRHTRETHSPVHLVFTHWLNFPSHSMSLTLASPNFLNRASLQTPGHFRSLPDSTNMFFGALPRILWHTPMPTPNLLSCLTMFQTTARGQWRWREDTPIYSPSLSCHN